MNPSRQPKGAPNGGQFAPSQRAEAEVTLDGGPLAACGLLALRDAKAALVADRAEHRQVVVEEQSGHLPHTFTA